MSPSTFRQHFRAITGLSPLEYQKHRGSTRASGKPVSTPEEVRATLVAMVKEARSRLG